MRVESLHDWRVSASRAVEIQRNLAQQVSCRGEVETIRFVGGLDISVDKSGGTGTGVVVILRYPELTLAETSVVSGALGFPYIPGLLSFREAPFLLAACERLTITPDLILVDGQGVAHPRRIGLASHLGLWLDTPTVGCAKSLLCGRHETIGEECGDYAEIIDREEVVGVALRTKQGVKPIYVSVGHKISLESAIKWVLKCGRGYRLPEPTRLAHLAAGGNLKLKRDMTPAASR